MNTALEISKTNKSDTIKYCSDYDSECKCLSNPGKCFLGGVWTCENGVTRNVSLADGVCKEMEIRGLK